MSAPSTPRKGHKVVLIGDSQCGKSSLMRRFLNKTFMDEYNPTIFDSGSVKILVDQNNDVPVIIWDTSGSSEYNHVRPLSYDNAAVFVVCFDISNASSLDNVQRKWVPEIKQGHPDKPIILVGCKSDLKTEQQKPTRINKMTVISTQGLTVAREIGAVAYYECTSKQTDGEGNVSSLFQATALLSTDQVSKIPKDFKIREEKRKLQKTKYNKCPVS